MLSMLYQTYNRIKRARLADLFQEIGDVLNEIVDRKKHNKKSMDLCAELGVLPEHFLI